jgi:hypothetical protein
MGREADHSPPSSAEVKSSGLASRAGNVRKMKNHPTTHLVNAQLWLDTEHSSSALHGYDRWISGGHLSTLFWI